MRPNQFEELCNKSRLHTFPKMFAKNHEVYYAEGYRDPDENLPEPHYRVLWAVGSEEKLDVAQDIYIPVGTSQDARMKMARDSALRFIDACNDVGRY